MKLTTLDKFPELYGSLIKLIEEGFHYPTDESFAIDFFPLVKRENWNHCHLLLDEDDKIAAHIGVSQRRLSNLFPITLLGGIIVSEAQQGKGLLSQLLKAVIDKYLSSTTFFLLWSDLDQLYQKYNFFQAGVCCQIGDTNLIPPKSFTQTSMQDISTLEWSTLKQLYKDDICSRYLTLFRSEEDWSALRGIKSTELFISHDHNGEMDSYFFYGKGGDLGGIIHEFGAKPEARVKRLKELNSFRLWLPECASPIKTIYLGLFRLGSQMKMNEFLDDISDGQIQLKGSTPDEIAFLFQDKEYQIKIKDFWPLLLGPERAQEFEQLLKPLYFSGLDTI